MGLNSASAIVALCFSVLLVAEASVIKKPSGNAAISGAPGISSKVSRVDTENAAIPDDVAIAAIVKELQGKLANIEKKILADSKAYDSQMEQVTRRYESRVLAVRTLLRPTGRVEGEADPQLDALKAQNAKIEDDLNEKIKLLKSKVVGIEDGSKASHEQIKAYAAQVESGIVILKGKIDARWKEIHEADQKIYYAERRATARARLAALKEKIALYTKGHTMDADVFKERLAELEKEAKMARELSAQKMAVLKATMEANKAAEAEERKWYESIVGRGRQQVQAIAENAAAHWNALMSDVSQEIKKAEAGLIAAKDLATQQILAYLAKERPVVSKTEVAAEGTKA